jgi:mono/diheme cytochrome c family protein
VTKRGIASALGALLAVLGSWIGWRGDGSEPVRAAPVLDGATLFQAKGCATCHTGPESNASDVGGFPSLAEAPSWAGSRRAGLSAEEYLEESIREPWAFISPEFHGSGGPTTAMPQLGLSDAERDAVVAFLLRG